MTDTTLEYADMELCARFPQYARLAPGLRRDILDYVETVEVPRVYGERLGSGVAAVVAAVIAIVSVAISTTVGMVALIVNAVRGRKTARLETATQSIIAAAETKEAEASAIEADRKRKERSMIAAVVGVGAIAAVAAFLSF